ncbi:MAG: hypothetical protein IPP81_08840 [Chitinophagaceae bacterium]|nr:hypothetical protein [Chitinophagaceae bacterium]
MNTPNKIDTLDEALRVIFLESAKETDAINPEQEMNQILSSVNFVMSDAKKTLMLEKLNTVSTSLSFGQLLQKAIVDLSTTEAVIAEKSNLPFEIIENLKNDSIYTNNVPIKLFKNLVSFLNISFKAVEESVRKTFEILQSPAVAKSDSFSGFSPAFRKGYYASRESLTKNTPATDGKELFENKESLEKYLSRLNELMNS